MRSASDPRIAEATPAARWRENGDPDPHGNSYDCERAKLCGGHLTDDEVAFQTAMLMRHDLNHEAVLQTAKDRIRWLSRKLTKALATSTNLPDAPVGWQPIETAPTDGYWLGWSGVDDLPEVWSGKMYRACMGHLPPPHFPVDDAKALTHWHSLPTAPAQVETSR